MTVQIELRDFLSNLADFQTIEDRQSLIDTIGLSSVKSKIIWDGNAQSFVGSLLTVLTQQGQDSLDRFLIQLEPYVGGLEKQKKLSELQRTVKALTSEEWQREFLVVRHLRVLNSPPVVSLAFFQNREVETKAIGNFLRDRAKGVLYVYGRSGIGKTALVYRLLKHLEENGQLPDNGGPLELDTVIYETAHKTAPITTSSIYNDLCSLLDPSIADKQRAKYNNPNKSIKDKMDDLLETLPERPFLLVLNDFEKVIDLKTNAIADGELFQALHSFIHFADEHTPHTVKVIIISAEPAPEPISDPGVAERVEYLPLSTGLASPYAEHYLRALDEAKNGRLGTASQEMLSQALVLTQGYPKALLVLDSVLNMHQDVRLEDVLHGIKDKGRDIDYVMTALVASAFERLDSNSQKVMQALSVFGRPVPATAVANLLRPYVPTIVSTPESTAILDRLVERSFVLAQGQLYSLHQIDQRYCFSNIPDGVPSDRNLSEKPRFTKAGLVCRGAEYFKQVLDYDAAVHLLLTVNLQFMRYGEYQFLKVQYEALRNTIRQPWLKMLVCNNLGIVYDEGLGDYERAIICYTEATKLAQHIMNRYFEAASLGNLASCYESMGMLETAIENAKQALMIAREDGEQQLEWTVLIVLGNCYFDLGQTANAISYYLEAATISDRLYNAIKVGYAYTGLGNCYMQLGEYALAEETFNKVLETYKGQKPEIQQQMKPIRGTVVHSMAEMLIDQGAYEQAIYWAKQGAATGNEISDIKLESENYSALALAYLLQSDLVAANNAIRIAKEQDYPDNRHHVLALYSLVALLQGDLSRAATEFEMACKVADNFLVYDEHNYLALYIKGLALCGLVLCGDHRSTQDAVNAYRAARAINSVAGVIRRARILFEALAQVDKDGILREVWECLRDVEPK